MNPVTPVTGRFFTADDHVECVGCYEAFFEALAGESAASDDLSRLMGSLGGIKRRARTRMIIGFAHELEGKFEDISLHMMKFAMRRMFGVAVSHEDLMAWTTPGRKADSRVDKAAVAAVADGAQAQAAARLVAFNADWQQVRASAKELAKRGAKRPAKK